MKHKIRLKNFGNSVSIKKLPSEFVDTISHIILYEKDPFMILAGYAYMINGMKINEIKDRFVLIEQGRTRIASREYARQKVITFYNKIRDHYNNTYDIQYISPINDDDNFNAQYGYSTTDTSELPPVQDDINDKNTEEDDIPPEEKLHIQKELQEEEDSR
jgi:hypothetical protein